jgi:hypothetical protein
VDGGPELGGAGRIDLGRDDDGELPRVSDQPVVPPPRQPAVADKPAHRRGDGDGGQPRSVADPVRHP